MAKNKHDDYEGFIEKFKPKKTTDDCYTPPLVYDAVKEWVRKEYGVTIIKLSDRSIRVAIMKIISIHLDVLC